MRSWLWLWIRPISSSQDDKAKADEKSGNGKKDGNTAARSKPSPVKPVANRGVYYPGTEELKPNEMRVICLGSGMPMPRLKQAAASFLVELGNGDKFIFDMGTGAMHRLYALGIQLDYIDKVFLTHLHMDHVGDLPALESATVHVVDIVRERGYSTTAERKKKREESPSVAGSARG